MRSPALRDKTISLTPVEQPHDRYGRTVAQVFADGLWVQAALLKAGEVRGARSLERSLQQSIACR